MAVENYRTLIALRYAAESVDEVNVFLARALEVQLRLQSKGELSRIVGYLTGAAATVAGAYAIGGEFFAPGITLAAYLGLMFCLSVFQYLKLREQEKELLLDQTSVKDYLKKITQDRTENKVSIAIQNRIAADRELKQDTVLDEDEKRYLGGSIVFWGKRIAEEQRRLEKTKDGPVWSGSAERYRGIAGWIEEELRKRPL